MSADPDPQNNDAHRWYEENASRFEAADVIEVDFVGLDPDAQHRLNHFKLYALDSGEYVSFSGKDVLDFGAGHGRLALAYPDMKSYLGVDYSANLVQIGNRRIARAGLQNKAQLVHGSVLEFETPRRFDVVCSLGMMTYFNDPLPAVRKMLALLKPGGVLFFDFRLDSPIYSPIRKIKWAIRPPTGGMSNTEKPAALRRALESMGLQQVEVVSREFPLLANLHAKRAWKWPLALRNGLARSSVLRAFSTEAWIFARRP